MQVSLSWNANTEADLDRYNVYRNGVFLASTKQTSYVDAAIPAGTQSVSYTLTAVDTSGNESAHSAVVTEVFLPPPTPKPTTMFTIEEGKDRVTVSWPASAYSKVNAPRTTKAGITKITITGIL